MIRLRMTTARQVVESKAKLAARQRWLSSVSLDAFNRGLAFIAVGSVPAEHACNIDIS